jgi:hypothetical protein
MQGAFRAGAVGYLLRNNPLTTVHQAPHEPSSPPTPRLRHPPACCPHSPTVKARCSISSAAASATNRSPSRCSSA